MAEIAEECAPITGRGVGYKLFSRGLIEDMSRRSMAAVYRLLLIAREEEVIDWDLIVDESRSLEISSSWRTPKAFASSVINGYRRDYWDQQSARVEVWSEKGTVRGVLAPVLNEFGVGFRVMHGFNSATSVHDAAQDYDGKILWAYYVGDYDPSGMYMSEADLPARLEKYGGDHIVLCRIALDKIDVGNVKTFPASDKSNDTRHPWFVKNYGNTCAELDALDPNELRQRVRENIESNIEPDAWNRCKTVEAAERESLQAYMTRWGKKAIR
jgi:hypothetical protein